MSFYRAPFRDFVREQLDHRVDFLARGRGSEGRPLKWYQQYLTKQAFVRVAPLVKIKSFGDDPPPGFPEGGSTLFMKNFVLEGTPLIWNRDREGGTSDGKILKQWFGRAPQFPTGEGLIKGGKNLSLLNNPDLRTTPDNDGFGIIPPPGVVSFGIDTKSFYGNLREAKLSIRCFSIKQFEWIEKLYARPGHHVTIEWGWSHYINNKTGKIEQQGDLLTDAGNEIFWAEKASAGKIYRELESRKKERSGNYDGFLGIIKNFQSKMDTDGGFTIDVQLIGRGDLMYSLKLNESGDIPSQPYEDINTFIRDDNAFVTDGTAVISTFTNDNEAKENKTAVQTFQASGKNTNLVNLCHYMMLKPLDETFRTDSSYVYGTIFNVRKYLADVSKIKVKYSMSTNIVSNILDLKLNADAILLYDWAKESYKQGEEGNFDYSTGDNGKMVGHKEIGLGSFVRLGHLIKMLNSFCVASDGNEIPLLSINNMLYTKDFDPLFKDSDDIKDITPWTSMYSSCYSEFNIDSQSPFVKEFIERLNEAINQGPDGQKVVTQYIKEVRMYIKSIFTSTEDNRIFQNPALANLLDTIGVKYAEVVGGGAGNWGNLIKLIEYATNNIGSCQPSKILFPHQFATNPPSLPTQTATTEGITGGMSQEMKRLYNLNIITRGADNTLHPFEWNSLFTNPATIKSSFNTKLIKTKGTKYALSSYAFLDSLMQMNSLNQLSRSPSIYSIYHSLLTSTTYPNVDPWDVDSTYYNDKIQKIQTKGRLFGPVEFFDKLNKVTKGKFNPKRVIDNILINSNWLSLYAEDNAESLTLGNFLEEICKQINTASGGATDLKIIDNPVFSNQVSIVDFNVNSKTLKEEKQFSFPKTGHTSIYKSISLTGKIPDAQASTIAIGAQGPRDATNIEAVTYKAFLEDVEDRISNGGNSNRQRILNSNIKVFNKHTKKTTGFLKNMMDVVLFYTALNMDSGSTKKDWFNKLEGKAKSAMTRMNKDINYLAQTDYGGKPVDPNSTSLPLTSIIPLKINIGMEGVSGILASNTFKLDKGILPQKYNQSRVSYMVSKEKQTVKGGVWETSIEGTLVLDDNVTTVVTKTPNIVQAKKNKVSKLQANTNPVGDARLYESFEDEFGFVEIPGTYNDNNKNPIELVWIDDGFVKKELALPYLKMKKAAKSQGIKLFVVSGFRPPYESIKYKDGGKTYAASSQDYLYQSWLAQDAGKTSYVYNGTDPRYQGKTITLGSFNRAASPGGSNHGNGIALDIKTGGDSEGRYLNEAFDENYKARLETYEWLIKNSWKFGFVRTVPTEEWHYDYRTDVAANGPYAVLSAEDLGKKTTKFYNKTKQGTHKGLDELQSPDWGSTISEGLTFTPTVASIYPFPNRTEGNKFRGWINDNKTVEEIAAIFTDSKFGDTTLDRSGSSSNIYVKRAWEEWGTEYGNTL